MKSRNGFWAAVIFLSAIPIGLIVQIALGYGAETVLHVAFAAGSALLARAAFDFRTPLWISIAAGGAISLLAAIFFLQGLSAIVHNHVLNYIAFDALGHRPERLLIDSLLLWYVAAVFFESEGRTKLLGIFTVAFAVVIEIYNYWLNYSGTTLDAEFAILKIGLLFPFVWLLFESRKPQLVDDAEIIR